MKYCYLIIIAIGLNLTAISQEQWKIFKTTNSPLQTNEINYRGVVVDNLGNFWFGTEYGLYKYDGVFWNYYNPTNSGLPYYRIEEIVIDKLDNLWFPVHTSLYPYFVKFNGNNWEKVDTNQTCFAHIGQFVVDEYGTKWIETDDHPGIIKRYDGYSCITYEKQDIGINPENPLQLRIDNNNNFCISSDGYLYNWGGLARTNQIGWISSSEYMVTSFVIDNDNNEIWVANFYYTSLRKLSYDSLQLIESYSFPQFSIYGDYLSFDSNRNIWLYLSDFGLYVFHPSSESWDVFTQNNSPLPSNQIKGIAVDYRNNICIGTANGIALFNETELVLPPQLTNEDTLDFGEQLISSLTVDSLKIFNHYAVPLVIDSLNISLAAFLTVTSTPLTILPNDSATIVLEFYPDTVMQYEGKMTLHTNLGMYTQVIIGNGVSSLDIEEIQKLMNFTLSQNYPNPFNPETKIEFTLPEMDYVTLKVYDILGNEVNTLVNEEKSTGKHQVSFDAKGLSSGIYFYQLKSKYSTLSKKMIYLK